MPIGVWINRYLACRCLGETPKRRFLILSTSAEPSRSFAFTFGASHTQSSWTDIRRVSWPKMVEMLTTHVPGTKEGACLVPAVFTGSSRKKEDAAQIDVAFLDSDSGATLEDITAALKREGWEAVVSSTHSHMTTRTTVSISNWDRYFAKNPDATATDFLIDEKGYLPAVAQGAALAETSEKHIHIEHAPCPKFRVAVPLLIPWRASDYRSQIQANDAWKARIEALACALKLPHDQACTDTSRLFYLPRRSPHGVEPEVEVVSGDFCDIFAIPEPVDINKFFKENTLLDQELSVKSGEEYVDPLTGEYIDLTSWARLFGSAFQIAKALKVRRPESLTGLIVDNSKVHIRCPNEDAHTTPGQDNATFCINAASTTTKGFVIHCRHAHCTGKDRLFFIKKMLSEHWIEIADLTDTQFHASATNGHANHADDPGFDPNSKPIEGHIETALPLVWFDDIEMVLDARDFVQGVLVEQGAVVVYGESNAGKTFFVTDLALHVAAGVAWNDRRVEQGGVVYCVLEGGAGFRNRVAAWRDRTGHKNIPFAAIPVSLNLLDPDADTPKLIAAIQTAAQKIDMPVKLVVIDTFSRAMAGGNENAPDDMGLMVRNMDAIRAATGCCLLFVHHSGKDAAKGARGHSLLRAAIDTEIEVVAADGEPKKATIVKQREMKKGDVFGFDLKVVELGVNRYGEKVTTCVVYPVEASGQTGHNGKKRKLSPSGQIGTRALYNAMSKFGTMLPALPEYPPNTSAVSASDWRDEFYQLYSGTLDVKKHAFSRAETDLLASNVITARNGLVWFVSRRECPEFVHYRETDGTQRED